MPGILLPRSEQRQHGQHAGEDHADSARPGSKVRWFHSTSANVPLSGLTMAGILSQQPFHDQDVDDGQDQEKGEIRSGGSCSPPRDVAAGEG